MGYVRRSVDDAIVVSCTEVGVVVRGCGLGEGNFCDDGYLMYALVSLVSRISCQCDYANFEYYLMRAHAREVYICRVL